jgi:hypothetical protein
MSLPRPLFACLCLAVVVLAGCGKGGSNSGNGNVRVVNAFFEAPSLNVVIGNTTLATGLPFQGLTQYASVDNGTQTFTVTVTGSSTPLVNVSNTIGGNTSFTYAIFGPLTAPLTIFQSDNFNDPGTGFFAVRAMNAAAGIGPIDVYLTPPGADLTVTGATVSGVPYGGTSAFISVNIGAPFEIRITPTGTKTVIFDSTPKAFAEHSGSTVLAYSKGSGTLVNVALLNSDDAGTGSIVDNLVAQYKVINASLVGSPLNVFIDGSLQLSSIPFTGVSNYQQTTAGAHTFNIQAQSTPGANLLTFSPTLSSATDTSIALVGPAGALGSVVLLDDNQPPATGSAGVRFVNTSASIAAVDVFVNFSKQITNLAINTASAYSNLTATALSGTAYEFDFNVSGTTSVVLKLPGVLLLPGHKYTVYLAGTTGSLQGIVTQDE